MSSGRIEIGHVRGKCYGCCAWTHVLEVAGSSETGTRHVFALLCFTCAIIIGGAASALAAQPTKEGDW